MYGKFMTQRVASNSPVELWTYFYQGLVKFGIIFKPLFNAISFANLKFMNDFLGFYYIEPKLNRWKQK